MRKTVLTYYLEMTDPGQLRPALTDRPDVAVRKAEIPCPELSRFLYLAVGGDWYWVDRIAWTYDEWLSYLDRRELETWVLYVSGTPAGYAELEEDTQSNVKVQYFGLLPRFVGGGLGGHLLTVAIERAWALGARRVWLHTCSLDHPAALANYQARGLRIYRQEEGYRSLPRRPLGPWPGARR